jgi:hypothetical protein
MSQFKTTSTEGSPLLPLVFLFALVVLLFLVGKWILEYVMALWKTRGGSGSVKSKKSHNHKKKKRKYESDSESESSE